MKNRQCSSFPSTWRYWQDLVHGGRTTRWVVQEVFHQETRSHSRICCLLVCCLLKEKQFFPLHRSWNMMKQVLALCWKLKQGVPSDKSCKMFGTCSKIGLGSWEDHVVCRNRQPHDQSLFPKGLQAVNSEIANRDINDQEAVNSVIATLSHGSRPRHHISCVGMQTTMSPGRVAAAFHIQLASASGQPLSSRIVSCIAILFRSWVLKQSVEINPQQQRVNH